MGNNSQAAFRLERRSVTDDSLRCKLEMAVEVLKIPICQAPEIAPFFNVGFKRDTDALRGQVNKFATMQAY